MINIRIHIENECEIFDENVFIDCKLPSVPQIGDLVHLTNDIELCLEQKCLKSETKDDYLDTYTYGSGFSFGDCIEVKFIKYIPNDNKIYISLGKSE